MSEPEERLLRTAPNRKLADEWVLVLVAEGLSTTLRKEGGTYTLWISEADFESAEQSLRSYARENSERIEGQARDALTPSPWRTVLAVQLGLVGFQPKSSNVLMVADMGPFVCLHLRPWSAASVGMVRIHAAFVSALRCESACAC